MKSAIFCATLVLLCLGSVSAQALKARGATKLRHETDAPAVDIEDVIRAEYDPNFVQYVKERERDRKAQTASLEQYHRERLAEKQAREKEYQKYLKERQKEPVVDEEKGEREHLREEEIWQARQERARLQDEKMREREAQKHETEKMARLQRAFSSDRLPASLKNSANRN